MARRLRFDTRCNSNLFTTLCQILQEMTGVKWGFMRRGHKIQYISSEEIPVKIGVPRCRNVDYIIGDNVTMIDHIKCKLKAYLITVTSDKELLYRIKSYLIDSPVGDLYADAAESNMLLSDVKICDAWLSGTEFVHTDEIPELETFGDW